MQLRGNPYVYLAVTMALVVASSLVDSGPAGAALGLAGVASAAVAVVLFLRRRRDPNGPPGQH